MNYYRSCGCGETSKSVAVMSRTNSEYIFSNVPTIEIEQNISWLTSIKQDCDYKINMLEGLKKSRQRSKSHRKKIRNLVMMFCDDDALHLDLETRTKIIKQRLGCKWSRAEYLAEKVQKHAKERLRFFRDQKIRLDHGMGLKPASIAKRHDLTRQQVYNILKKDVKQEWHGKSKYLERLITNDITFFT